MAVNYMWHQIKVQIQVREICT